MPLWERIKSIFGFNKKTRTKSSEIPNLDVFLYELLGYQPKNIEIYEKAFIHRSAQVKDVNGNDVNFERLEFLGDAVLGLIIAVYIFEKAPHKQEGYLTKMRSKMVSRQQLNNLGKHFRLVDYLHPDGNPNLGEDIYGNLVEALIGAMYLDKGFEFTSKFISEQILEKRINLDRLERSIASHKSLILEWGQKTKNKISFNTFDEDNAEDLIVFVSVIRLNDKVVAKGRGTSKKKAEENASRRAYYFLQKKMDNVL